MDIGIVLLTLSLLWVAQPTQASVCLHYHNPLDVSQYKIMNCPEVFDRFADATRIPIIQNAVVDPFQVSFSCGINDTAVCKAAKETCKQAGSILASALDIVQPITIKVTFISFCKTYGLCTSISGGGSSMILGRARPAVSHLMTDTLDGNRVREYPQALLKQFSTISPHPEYQGEDIIALFNSEANWYFDHEATTAMQADQINFLLTVLHEFVHGLGFLTNYSNDLFLRLQRLQSDIDMFLTPKRFVPPNANPDYAAAPNIMAPQGFWGFVESAFDKQFYYQGGNGAHAPVSTITDYLNTFHNGNALFDSLLEFVADWLSSPQCNVASALAKAAVTPGTFTLMPPGNDLSSVLYTSSSTYMQGTSISHLDTVTYQDTADFLMIPSVQMGQETHDATAALGPRLMRFLTALGYKQSVDPGPSRGLVIYQPPDDLVGTVSS